MPPERSSEPPFHRQLRFAHRHLGPGRAEVELVVEELHTHSDGVAHGGLLAALMDAALGHAVISGLAPEAWCATASLTISYLRRPKEGDRLVATGEVTRRGKRVAFARGEAVDGAGEVVGTAEGVWYIWPDGPPK
jgi:uncharacterized protein (TIGR00369 family)